MATPEPVDAQTEIRRVDAMDVATAAETLRAIKRKRSDGGPDEIVPYGIQGCLRPWPGAVLPPYIIFLDEETHTYTVHNWTRDFYGIPHDGFPTSKRIVSGTGMNRKYFEEFDPDECLDKYYDNWQKPGSKSQYKGMSRVQVKEKWNKAGRDASALGTEMHERCEFYYTKNDDTNWNTPEHELFLNFVKEVLPREKMAVCEMRLYSPLHRLCGSADIIAVGDDPRNVKILDYKRSKHSCQPDEHVFGKKYGNGACCRVPANSWGKYSVQLNLYRVMLQMAFGVKVESMTLVRLYPGLKNYELIDVPVNEEVIHQMLDERLKELRIQRLFSAAVSVVMACNRMRKAVGLPSLAAAAVFAEPVSPAPPLETVTVPRAYYDALRAYYEATKGVFALDETTKKLLMDSCVLN
jgi:hypothetical protein